MRLLYDQDDVVARWYSKETGIPFIPAHAAIGILDDNGELAGAALLQIVNPHTASLDLYSKVPSLAGIAPQIMRWAFHFCYRLEVTTSRSNKKMKRHLPRLGFIYECVVKHKYGQDNHGVQYSMTKDNCRWINGRSIWREQGERSDSSENKTGAEANQLQ